jgi:glycosyltransferase involved in cell wall biosynthesis
VRLGVYSDLRYRSEGGRLYTHQAFVRFVTALPPRVDEVVLFGRLDPEPSTSHYTLPSDGVRFVALPHYPSVTAVAAQLRTVREAQRIFASELDRLDAVWIFGPHPMALALATTARRHRTPLILGVRQDYPAYIRARLPSAAWGWAIPAAHALEASFRLLSRSAPTIAVGEALAEKYRRGKAPVLATGFSLVGRGDIVDRTLALDRSWDDEIRLLSVGRLDPEKNPLLLLEILERLRGDGRDWRLTIAGEGPLGDVLEARVQELGLADVVTLPGYVAQGEALRSLYRHHHAFVHVALTEGFPQVLFEAHAAGLPFVATDVGGVGPFVRRHGGGYIVAPADAAAAVEAIRRLLDTEARVRLVDEGLASAADETMEAQLDRIAEFFADTLPSGD